MKPYGKTGQRCRCDDCTIKFSRGREKQAAIAEIEQQIAGAPANACDAGTCDECNRDDMTPCPD